MDEYIWREQYLKANDLDDTRLEEYEIHVYNRKGKVFIKWRKGKDGAGG